MWFDCRTQNGWQVREWTLLRASPVEYVGIEKIYSNWESGSNSTHFDKFSVDVDQYGSGRLYSKSTDLTDAGIYACVVEMRHGLTSSSAQLIVLESIPMCDTKFSASFMEGNRIWMRCSVSFRGYWTPSMEWRHHGENKNGRIIAADEVENENFNFTSTIYIIFNSSTINSFFSCKIYFANEKNRRLANATNAPDFTYNWTSPEIKNINSAYYVVSPTPLIGLTTSSDTGFNSTINLYFVSLTAVGTMAAFFCCVTTILCIRMRRKASVDSKTMSSKEVNRAILSGQGAVSHASSMYMYENIDDEAIMATQTIQEHAHLSVLHPGSRPSSTGSTQDGEKLDSVALSINQKNTEVAERYENVEISNINQPSQTLLNLSNPDVEFPSPGGNDATDQSGYAPEGEGIANVKVVARVREPAPYESLIASTIFNG